MLLTKKGHSCVRLAKDGATLVIDPGVFSEPDAAAGADALLVTHEHNDHFDEGRLRVALDANPAAARLFCLLGLAILCAVRHVTVDVFHALELALHIVRQSGKRGRRARKPGVAERTPVL